MKRILLTFFTVILCISFAFSAFAVDEDVNIIDAAASTFEGISDVKQTKWFKLIDAKGDSKVSDDLYKSISIKTDGGHSGNNYLSITADKSWYSPSINIYPYLKEAGSGTYIISFWCRCTPAYSPQKYILIRSREADVFEDESYGIDVQARSGNNYYAHISGSYSEPDANGWQCFISDSFDIEDELLEAEHCWWFCVDSLPGSQFTYDIDDFCIVNEDDFEDPTEVEEEKINTELTYLTDDMKNNIIEAVKVTAAPAVTPTPDATPDATPSVPANTSPGAAAYISGSIVLLIAIAASFALTLLIKKKKR